MVKMSLNLATARGYVFNATIITLQGLSRYLGLNWCRAMITNGVENSFAVLKIPSNFTVSE